MLVNGNKCKVMRLGVSNENEGYFVANRQFEMVVDECDLRIIMQINLRYLSNVLRWFVQQIEY